LLGGDIVLFIIDDVIRVDVENIILINIQFIGDVCGIFL